MYVSITTWRDLTDGHVYREGDPFPFDGRQVPEERLAELESGRNQAGLRLIQAKDAGKESEDRKPEERKAPEETAEKKSSRGSRSRKKAE